MYLTGVGFLQLGSSDREVNENLRLLLPPLSQLPLLPPLISTLYNERAQWLYLQIPNDLAWLSDKPDDFGYLQCTSPLLDNRSSPVGV